jgi:hypothetical protein
MKRLDKEEQVRELVEVIFVPRREADRVGSRGVELRSETFYSPGEMSGKEAAANGTNEREDLYEPTAQTGQIF